MRPSSGTLALGGLGMLFAVGYPLAAESALASWGTRTVGGGLAAAGLLSLVFLRRVGDLPGVPVTARVGLLALPALAAASDLPVFLRLVPAAIQVLLVAVFLGSLRGGGSVFQEAARSIHPYAPDFIGSYCRRVTRIFAGMFALQGMAVAWLALWPPVEGWALASGMLVWVPVSLACVVEWAVRKSWFRYYSNGPVDRLLRSWLPPEDTAPGRRSLEYMRRMRRELGMPPP